MPMPSPAAVRRALDQTIDFLVASADYERQDRLWPAHYRVFSTNPMGIAHGACGIAIAVHETRRSLTPAVEAWMHNQPITPDEYPPGLYVGTAGIAYAFARLGWIDRAEAAMDACYASPLRYADPTLFCGAAGWGGVSLFMYEQTGNERYLRAADDAARHLLSCAETGPDGLSWRHAMDQRIHHGFGYGASGVGLFLLHAGLRLDNDAYLHAARRAVDFELANVGETNWGVSWPDVQGGSVALPYLAHGSSGIGSVLLRFHRALGGDRYLRMARRIGEAVSGPWTVLPCLAEGLSGLADFNLDLYAITGEEQYLDRAWRMADTVLWYAVPRETGIAFPGRWLSRISNDFATGGAGIALLFHRLVHGNRRVLFDFVVDGFPTPSPRVEGAPRSTEPDPHPDDASTTLAPLLAVAS